METQMNKDNFWNLQDQINRVFNTVNLQRDCHNVIFLNFSVNINTLLQAIGRVWRIGQTKESQVYVLTCDRSYDHTLQQRAAAKVIGQVHNHFHREHI